MPLALGTGIPVVDALLNSTAAVQLQQQITTATQNVAQTLKQIDQYVKQVQAYETQLMQYAQQIKDATLPVSQVWNQAQGTMRDMMGLVNQAQGGQMLAYLQQYKDLNGWLSSNGGYYNPAAIQQGYALQKSHQRYRAPDGPGTAHGAPGRCTAFPRAAERGRQCRWRK